MRHKNRKRKINRKKPNLLAGGKSIKYPSTLVIVFRPNIPKLKGKNLVKKLIQ